MRRHADSRLCGADVWRLAFCPDIPAKLRPRPPSLLTGFFTHSAISIPVLARLGVIPSKLAGGSKQRKAARCVSSCMESDGLGEAGAVCFPGPARPQSDPGDGAEVAVGALYQASAVSLIRLAYVILGDRPSAEDVVQEAFCSLYRRWDRLADTDSALYYVRSSVLNGCRSALRSRAARRRRVAYELPTVSAEAVVLSGQEREEVIRAVGRLPFRQREVLVLRFYLDLSDEQIARVMGIRQSTVRSTAHRGLEAVSRALKETS
jgi:RNA polymerase sigma-70 factor (sigma-E family)